MSWTLTTSGAAIWKAGANVNYGECSGAMSIWSEEAEGRIEAETRRTWVASYSGLSTPIKAILSDVASSLIAMKMIAYDTTGYLSREADTLLNVNEDTASSGLKILKDFKSNELKAP